MAFVWYLVLPGTHSLQGPWWHSMLVVSVVQQAVLALCTAFFECSCRLAVKFVKFEHVLCSSSVAVRLGHLPAWQACICIYRVECGTLRAAVALRCSCIATPHRVCSAAHASTCLPTPHNTVTPGHPKPAFRSRKQADCPHLGILIFLAARVEWGRVMADRPWHVVGSHVFFLSLLLGNVQE